MVISFYSVLRILHILYIILALCGAVCKFFCVRLWLEISVLLNIYNSTLFLLTAQTAFTIFPTVPGTSRAIEKTFTCNIPYYICIKSRNYLIRVPEMLIYCL